MTAKRFTTKNIICSNYCVWDNNDKSYGNDEVVELLNELHEENKNLIGYLLKTTELSREKIKQIMDDDSYERWYCHFFQKPVTMKHRSSVDLSKLRF